MIARKDFYTAGLTAAWFMLLTLPLLVIKIVPGENIVVWRWQNALWVGGVSFCASLAYRMVVNRRSLQREQICSDPAQETTDRKCKNFLPPPRFQPWFLAAGAFFFLAFPFLFSTYQITIMSTALIYVMLGLGLNIVVGMAGLLNLGYVAFYAVGAYAYALLHLHFGIGFWTALPIGGFIGAMFGILLGFPVLRLRGDYLAIVTLGFGEITRLVLENWDTFSRGPSGISNIPRPGFFGLELSLTGSIIYFYYLMIAMVLITLFLVNRLQNSRIGRAWFALREDEIACQAMGIDKTQVKLTAFALGACWAGMGGVLFAAKTTFVNPASFTFLESAIILCIVVLGGMGSIIGVVIAALILILLPEYLRAAADYRMLSFGVMLVLMMLFRPQGIMTNIRQTYTRNS